MMQEMCTGKQLKNLEFKSYYSSFLHYLTLFMRIVAIDDWSSGSYFWPVKKQIEIFAGQFYGQSNYILNLMDGLNITIASIDLLRIYMNLCKRTQCALCYTIRRNGRYWINNKILNFRGSLASPPTWRCCRKLCYQNQKTILIIKISFISNSMWHGTPSHIGMEIRNFLDEDFNEKIRC